MMIPAVIDGVHVHPGAVAAAWQAKGPSGLALVSDAMAAAGLGDGSYQLGGVEVLVDGDRAVNRDGRLAGSVVSLDRALRNLRRFTGCSTRDAIAAATATPAAVIGDRAWGGLGQGKRADVTLLDDTLSVQLTAIGGRVAFNRIGPQL